MSFGLSIKSKKSIFHEFIKNKKFNDAVTLLDMTLGEMIQEARTNPNGNKYGEKVIYNYNVDIFTTDNVINIVLSDATKKNRNGTSFNIIYIEYDRKRKVFKNVDFMFPIIHFFWDTYYRYPLERWKMGEKILDRIVALSHALKGHNENVEQKEIIEKKEHTEPKNKTIQKENDLKTEQLNEYLATYKEISKTTIKNEKLKRAFDCLIETLEICVEQYRFIQDVIHLHDAERMILIEISDFLSLYSKLEQEKKEEYNDRYLILIQAMEQTAKENWIADRSNMDLELEKQFKVLEERYLKGS